MNINRTYTFLLFLFLITICSDLKAREKKIWVLVVGISEYQFFNSLSYADDDAQSFYSLLKANFGDQLDESEEGNVKLLLNKEATGAAITSALSWLVRNVNAGDDAYIYFSGHGAQEDITAFKLGYLVGHDCFDQSYSNGGTLPMHYLQKILQTLSIKDVNTFFFADACHAGKKDGETGDLEHLNSVLSGQVGKITKVLAAQGKELSWEDSRWGGGHGVFTYYLIKGMSGAADIDPVDDVITVRELNSYLDNNIPKETDYQQNPRIISDSRNTAIVRLNPESLKEIRKEFEVADVQAELGSLTASRGLIASIKDPKIREHYINIVQFVKKSEEESALREYQILQQYLKEKASGDSDLETLMDLIIDQMYTAFMNYGQRYINGFMETEHLDFNREKLTASLALEIIEPVKQNMDSTDFRYPYVLTREHFFKAQYYHNQWHKDNFDKREVLDFLPVMESVLKYDSTAAYLFYQISALYYHLDEPEKAIYYADKAVKLAPSWAYAFNNRGNVLQDLGKFEEAELAYKNGAALDTETRSLLERNIADNFVKQKKWDSAAYYMNKALNTENEKSAMSIQKINMILDQAFLESDVSLKELEGIWEEYGKQLIDFNSWVYYYGSSLMKKASKKTGTVKYRKEIIKWDNLLEKHYFITFQYHSLSIQDRITINTDGHQLFDRYSIRTYKSHISNLIDIYKKHDPESPRLDYLKFTLLHLKGKEKKAQKFLVELKEQNDTESLNTIMTMYRFMGYGI